METPVPALFASAVRLAEEVEPVAMAARSGPGAGGPPVPIGGETGKAHATSREAQGAPSRRCVLVSASSFAAAAGLSSLPWPARALERRNDVGFLRGPYNLAFFYRHNYAYRIGAAMHFFHSKQHDLLQQTPLAERARYDQLLNDQSIAWLRDPPRTEPTMDYYSEYVDRGIHTLFRTIDWTHMHHEQTYDIMSDRRIPWAEKKRWTDRAVRYYLTMQTPGVPRSCAPLDVTMRRAGLMMKPYNTYFRNYYPKDQSLFYIAHWWHPAIYEAQMIAGNGTGQERAIAQVAGAMWRDMVMDGQRTDARPQRMVLSREIMPRYSMMSPESANIFDNLHMLHGIAYDILAYEGWTLEQKRDELYRVIHAMGYQPGDEALARKFSLPRPPGDVDPRVYSPWMRAPRGGMSGIMMEMMAEMMPGMPTARHDRVMEAMRMKMDLGMEPGEAEGSLHDALMRAAPGMRMMPGATEPGQAPQMMVQAMLRGWREKHGGMPDLPAMDMGNEPVLPPSPLASAG